MSSLHQVVRQRLLSGAASTHPPWGEALSLLVLREILPPTLAPTATHQVRSVLHFGYFSGSLVILLYPPVSRSQRHGLELN